MPKRKLKLWYNKDDYKREREEELARLKALETENEDLTAQPNVEAAVVEPATVESPVQPAENHQAVPTEGDSQQARAEQQMQTSTLPENSLPSEQTEVSQEPAQDTAEKAPVDEITPTAPAETTEAPIEMQPVATPLETESKPITNETQNASAPTVEQAPVEAQIQEVVTKVPIVIPAEVLPPAEPVPAIVEAVPDRFVGPVQEEETEEPEAEVKVPLIASVESLESYTQKMVLPTRAVVCIGEYPINLLLKGNLVDKKTKGVFPLFVDKSSKDVIKWSQGKLENGNVVCLDEEVDTHFWYDIQPFIEGNESFFAKVKSKPLDGLKGAILVASTWNGIGSALLPNLISKFADWKISALSLALLPSKAQPLDGQLNSFASLGLLTAKESATTILLDRDNLENYTGVDKNGSAINGNEITNYILDLMLSKETFVPELCEISKTFSSKVFTLMLAPGVSMKIYGSLENMLNTTLTRPLYSFDLSTATLLYVLIRMPFQLKDKLSRGKIELSIANWFKDKADLESIYIADPVYVEESSDRIDIALFVGGFDTATRFKALQARVEKMKNKAVKKGALTEESWQEISKCLVE